MTISILQFTRFTRRPVPKAWPLLVLVLLVGIAAYLWTVPTLQEHRLQAASLDQLQAASRREPNNPRVFYYLGLHLQGLGQTGAAKDAYARAITLDPSGMVATIRDLHQRGALAGVPTDRLVQDASALLARNDLDAAERGFDAILARDPTSAAACYSLGLILDTRGKTDEAFRAYSRAVQLQPTLYEARYRLALLYYHSGFEDEAERRMTALVAESPNVSRYWYGLGVCIRDDEARNLIALADFRRASALDPRSGECALILAGTEAKANQDEAAERDGRRALALSPGAPAPLLALGLFLLDHRLSPDGQAEAVRLLRAALALSPHDPAALAGLGRAALGEGKSREAVALLEAAEARSPGDPKIWYALGAAYARLGNKPRAAYCRTASLSLFDYTRNLGFAQELAQKNMADPKLRLRLARLYAQGGQYAWALNQYGVCRHLDPGSGEAAQEMSALTRRLRASGQMPSMSSFDGMVRASVKSKPQ